MHVEESRRWRRSNSSRSTASGKSLLLRLARDFHAEDGHPLSERGEAALSQAAHGHPLARAWLIEERGVVVGYTVLGLGFGIEYGGADAFVDDLYLIPAARGRGLGRQVLELVEAEARKDGPRGPVPGGRPGQCGGTPAL